MSPYQYRKSHCGDKMVVRSFYLHNGISYAGKITSLYWIRAQNLIHPAPSTTKNNTGTHLLYLYLKYNLSYQNKLPFVRGKMHPALVTCLLDFCQNSRSTWPRILALTYCDDRNMLLFINSFIVYPTLYTLVSDTCSQGTKILIP